MEIRAIVSDLDFTLFNARSTFSKKTLDVLHRARKKGIKILFATARSYETASTLTSTFIPDGFLFQNGALIYEGAERIAHYGIAHRDLRSFISLSLSLAPNVQISTAIDNRTYANHIIQDTALYSFKALPLNAIPERPAEKLLIRGLNDDDIQVLKEHLTDAYYLETDREGMTFIQSQQAKKHLGLAYISKRWGIPLCQFCGFGDDINDLELLRACGIGVAPKNAIPKVLAQVSHIAGHHDEDGVARWIEQHIL